ncbi:lipoyl synthase [Candidatus Marinamargulisbacteria bacterium SCGC AG-410-N11]|nr:lipoyl synthase [Candidatus Marinamargulisbacteria bacterium SCGC AG-410-N11]
MNKRLPEWLKLKKGKLGSTRNLVEKLDSHMPATICQEARCPNRSECFSKGLLTFMILGVTCTRNCSFCSVTFGAPKPPDLNELDDILYTIDKLNIKFVVLTSPNRDDLKDGGASHYHYIVTGIKKRFPNVKVEVLVPDFQGNIDDLKVVIDSRPDVINHNMETVPSLYSTVRKGSLYQRSLDLLKSVSEIDSTILTKSGLMVGLGESHSELITTIQDIKQQGVDILTLGQYLKPDQNSIDVAEYYHPDTFKWFEQQALQMGFRFVFAGPYVRSSYLAEHIFEDNFKELCNV